MLLHDLNSPTTHWAIPEKTQIGGEGGGGGDDKNSGNPPEICHFFTLPLEILDKTELNPWIFHKILLDLLEIPRLKTKTPGNSTLFFLDQP